MTNRGQWNPLTELLSVQKRMNELFESAMARTNFETREGFDAWTPVCDVYEAEGALVLDLELPGMVQNEIDLRLDGDELVVEGERKMEREQSGEQYHRVERSYGRFARRFRIPSTVDRDSVRASYRDGLLRVDLPQKGEGPSDSIQLSIR